MVDDDGGGGCHEHGVHKDDEGEWGEEEHPVESDPCVKLDDDGVLANKHHDDNNAITKEECDDDEDDDDEGQRPTRTVLRHRVVSGAYRRTFNKWRPKGPDKDSKCGKAILKKARAKAKAAYRAAGQSFDAKYPRRP